MEDAAMKKNLRMVAKELGFKFKKSSETTFADDRKEFVQALIDIENDRSIGGFTFSAGLRRYNSDEFSHYDLSATIKRSLDGDISSVTLIGINGRRMVLGVGASKRNLAPYRDVVSGAYDLDDVKKEGHAIAIDFRGVGVIDNRELAIVSDLVSKYEHVSLARVPDSLYAQLRGLPYQNLQTQFGMKHLICGPGEVPVQSKTETVGGNEGVATAQTS